MYHSHSVFDYSYFGLVLFRVYFKGGYIEEHDRDDIIKKLANHTYIVAVYELSGEFDLAIEMLSPNPSRFNKELKKAIDVIPTLNNFKIVLNIVTHIYPRLYLLQDKSLFKSSEPEIIIGGDRKVESFSEYELAVLRVLLSHPKIRFTTLAKEAGMNVKTALSVLKILRKRRIIKGFRYLVNTQKMGMEKVRVFLKLHNVSQERDKEMLEFFIHTSEILQVNKTVGDWDMEIDIESSKKAEIRKIIMRLREEFKDIIQNFNMIEFYDVYKRQYLPDYLFEEEQK